MEGRIDSFLATSGIIDAFAIERSRHETPLCPNPVEPRGILRRHVKYIQGSKHRENTYFILFNRNLSQLKKAFHIEGSLR